MKRNKYLYLLLAFGFTLMLDNKVTDNSVHASVTHKYKKADKKKDHKKIKVPKDTFNNNVTFTIKDKNNKKINKNNKKIKVNKKVFNKNVTFDVKKKIANKNIFNKSVTFNIKSDANTTNSSATNLNNNKSNTSNSNAASSSVSSSSASNSSVASSNASNSNVANPNVANPNASQSATSNASTQNQSDDYFNSFFQKVPDEYNSDIPWEKSNTGHDFVAKSFGNTIYYHIDSSLDSNYQNLVNQAIQDWNNLGVINLQPSNDNNQVGININYDNSQSVKNIYGVTYFNGSNTFKNNNEVLIPSQITLEPLLSRLGSDTAIKYTIEHEIGHALGFAHDTRKIYSTLSNNVFQTYVMYATENSDNTASVNTIPLGQREANALKQHYSN